MHSIFRRTLALAGMMIVLAITVVAEMETPSNACFSPGLMRLSEMEAKGASVSAQAEISISNAAYARDLSVLTSMLSGTTFEYACSGDAERLRIRRGEELLSEISLIDENADACLVIGEKAYICDEKSALQAMTGAELAEYDTMQAVAAALSGAALLERVPLTSVAAWLEGFEAGDVLLFGFAVTEPLVLERTMSDDGTRLTRISLVSGSIGREGEAPYQLSGYLRQPAGRAPKDTFELAFRRDDQNYIELSYSALRENEVTRRDRAGTASVHTSLKAAGRLSGSWISSRLNVTMKNGWTSDEKQLSERITITASLDHQDNRPEAKMRRMNSVDGTMRSAIRLTTDEYENDMITLSDDVSLEVIMDGNTFLAGGADMHLTVGGAGEEIGAGKRNEARAATAEQIAGALLEEAAAISLRIYPDLSEAAKDKATDGL